MRAAFLALTVALLSSGCSHEVLDWRNAQVVDGKVFNGQDNKPFTGELTGIPVEQIYAMAPAISNLLVYAAQHGAAYPSTSGYTCAASVTDGYVIGKVACEAAGKTFLAFELDKGHPTGHFQWSVPEGSGASGQPMIDGNFDANGKLDGELTFHRPDGKGKYMEMTLSHGKYDGDEIWYLKDGQTVGAQVPMKDGHITGPSTVRRLRTLNGAAIPVFEAHYDENGKWDGTFTGWSLDNAHPNVKVFVTTYSHGNHVGKCTGFDSAGNPGGDLNAQWDEGRRAYVNMDATGNVRVLPSYYCSTNYPLMMADQ